MLCFVQQHLCFSLSKSSTVSDNTTQQWHSLTYRWYPTIKPTPDVYQQIKKLLHLFDAIFVDSFQILCSIDENCGDEMTQSFKYIPVRRRTWKRNNYSKWLDHQALPKAKYCPRVATASCMQKNTRKPCDLDLWPMTVKFNRVRAVVKVHVHAKYHQAECSGSWVIVLTEQNSNENNTVRRYHRQ